MTELIQPPKMTLNYFRKRGRSTAAFLKVYFRNCPTPLTKSAVKKKLKIVLFLTDLSYNVRRVIGRWTSEWGPTSEGRTC